MTGVHQTVAGAKAAALSHVLGVDVEHDDLIVVAPQILSPQWFVDHPMPDEASAATWWALSSPERRALTMDQMRQAIEELQAMIDADKIRFKGERAKAARSKGAASMNVLDVLPDLAGRIKQAEELRHTLLRTRANLGRIYIDLNRRYGKQT